jgi:hypothetical protein
MRHEAKHPRPKNILPKMVLGVSIAISGCPEDLIEQRDYNMKTNE